jgi:hypothetical protein
MIIELLDHLDSSGQPWGQHYSQSSIEAGQRWADLLIHHVS